MLQTCALSLLVFTGASQFALVGVLAAGGAPLSGALTALLLGTRNTLYGLRLAPLLDWRGWRRLRAAHLVIDESTAMSVTRETTARPPGSASSSTGLAVFVLWNLATLAGALAGTAIGDPRTYGLDAAVGGAFLALLWPRLHDPAQPGGRPLAAAAVALGWCRSPRPACRCSPPAGVALLAGLLDRAARARRPPMTWAAVLVAGVGCYLLKLAGLSVPPRVLERPVVERVADLMPVALLAALVARAGLRAPAQRLVLDARLAGLGVAVVAAAAAGAVPRRGVRGRADRGPAAAAAEPAPRAAALVGRSAAGCWHPLPARRARRPPWSPPRARRPAPCRGRPGRSCRAAPGGRCPRRRCRPRTSPPCRSSRSRSS